MRGRVHVYRVAKLCQSLCDPGLLGFPGASEAKASACNEGDLGSSTGSHFLLMTSSSIFTPDSLVNFLPHVLYHLYDLPVSLSFLLNCWGELYVIALHP